MNDRLANSESESNDIQSHRYQHRYDSPPPKIFCPPGWEHADLNCRDSAMIAADYWEQAGDDRTAKWLRDWASLSPDGHERHRRKKPKSVGAWGRRSTKWAKTRRSRIERAACRHNPDVGHGYGIRGIW